MLIQTPPEANRSIRSQRSKIEITLADGPKGHKETHMGRGDNKQTLKMRRKRSQAKLKARIKRKIVAAKAAKKPATPSKKK